MDGNEKNIDELTAKPNAARMYDYYLGGANNFGVDREAAERIFEACPDARLFALTNRAFLRRAVRFLTEQGIDQFLDVGSGIPTVGNVHEVAQKANPNARVVYVDIDPVAVSYSQELLEGNANASAIRADARHPKLILAHPEVRRLLDLSRPLGVLLVAVLHFIPDDGEAYATVKTLRGEVAPGSYIAISHATHESMPLEAVKKGEEIYSRTTNPARARSRSEIERFFDGLALVEPGVVYAPLWRPETPSDLLVDQPERSQSLVGVGLKTV